MCPDVFTTSRAEPSGNAAGLAGARASGSRGRVHGPVWPCARRPWPSAALGQLQRPRLACAADRSGGTWDLGGGPRGVRLLLRPANGSEARAPTGATVSGQRLAPPATCPRGSPSQTTVHFPPGRDAAARPRPAVGSRPSRCCPHRGRRSWTSQRTRPARGSRPPLKGSGANESELWTAAYCPLTPASRPGPSGAGRQRPSAPSSRRTVASLSSAQEAAPVPSGPVPSLGLSAKLALDLGFQAGRLGAQSGCHGRAPGRPVLLSTLHVGTPSVRRKKGPRAPNSHGSRNSRCRPRGLTSAALGNCPVTPR